MVQKRNTYTVKAKLDVLNKLKESTLSQRQFAKAEGLSESVVRRWMQQSTSLKASCGQRRRVARKPLGMFPQVDILVNEWLLEQNNKEVPVKDSSIQRQALDARDKILATMEESRDKRALENFEASKIWCYRFKRRFGHLRTFINIQ